MDNSLYLNSKYCLREIKTINFNFNCLIRINFFLIHFIEKTFSTHLPRSADDFSCVHFFLYTKDYLNWIIDHIGMEQMCKQNLLPFFLHMCCSSFRYPHLTSSFLPYTIRQQVLQMAVLDRNNKHKPVKLQQAAAG